MGLILSQYLWAFVMMVLLLEGKWCSGCQEGERIALLNLKAYINYPNGKEMPSWGKIPNCCLWEYVECDSITGRVTSLIVQRDWGMEDWYLNTSFFVPFKELKSLDLYANNILGCVEKEGFERLSSLANLEYLDISSNKFNNSILPCLSGLSYLKKLYLYDNRLRGRINIQELKSLTSLKELYLDGNQIEGFEFFHGLSNLEVLHLSNNGIKNNMLSSLKGLSSLKSLDLSYNSLKGTFDMKGLRNLEILDLSGNRLTSNMLSFLKEFSSLKSLNLRDISLKGTFDMKELDSLSNLKELDLSWNEIIKFQASKDTRSLCKLRKLTLDSTTSYGKNSSLLQSLGAFPYLKTLSLRDNDFKGKIFSEESHGLNSLEELFLDDCSLDENFLQSLPALPSLKLLSLCGLTNNVSSKGFPNIKNLEHLYLNYSNSDSNILPVVANFTSLKTLSLFQCELSGSIPMGICELKHLQVLDMSNNDLNDTLPWCLANLTSLQQLDLSNNHFTGKISLFGGLSSIEELRLSKNHFQIPISLSPLFNNTELRHFDGQDNEFYQEIEENNLIPKFQLEELVLSGLGYIGTFPNFLYYQHNLNTIDLSHAKLQGGFPFWLLENNTKLESLLLVNNSLSGPLQFPVHSHMSLSVLDISNNDFYGHLPMGTGASLPMLQSLKISRNNFSGNIPDSFSNVSFLHVLQMDGNNFTGNIPDSLSECPLYTLDISDNHLSGVIPGWMGNMSHLKVLDLSKNNISGSLPSNFNPQNLIHIYLSENRIQGSITDAFYDCSELVTLDLRHNFLTRTIPGWLGNLSSLGYLSLSYNNLEGEIPNQLCNLDSLQLIDLSHNDLYGHIPPCLQCATVARHFDFTVNQPHPFDFTMKWNTYSYQKSILYSFSGIDLSDNKLSGEIPPEIGKLRMIEALNLSHNNLTGQIPSTFSNLSEIESLDLSYNNLDGEIPSNLTQLHYLSVFSVAHNNLSGRTPERVAQFATFESNSYEGNRFLCGLPLQKSCTEPIRPSSMPKVSTDDEGENGFIDMDIFYVSFLVAYIIILLAIIGVLWINPYWRRAWFHFIEVSVTNFQYFLEDNVYVLFKFRV